MAKYIKSHSNFRLSSRHQLVNGGVIYERDITTIGGISPLAAGQSTIYSSGNFIMTINNGGTTSRHVIKKNWVSNEDGDVWNGDVLTRQTSDINGSVEQNIGLTMTNDYMNLRSFACYGSLYMLIQNSIANIIDKFPYELYTGTGGGEYQKKEITLSAEYTEFNADATVKEDSEPYTSTVYAYKFDDDGEPLDYKDPSGNKLYKVSNPGNIDIHSTYVDVNTPDPLKYFANGGYLNYGFFDDRIEDVPEDGIDFNWKSEQSNITRPIANSSQHTLSVTTGTSIETFGLVIFSGDTNISTIAYDNAAPYSANTTFSNGDVLYLRNVSGATVVSKQYCPKAGDFIAKITINTDSKVSFDIYAFWDKDLNVVYGTLQSNLLYHLRPKASLGFYDDFIDSLDFFEKSLMGVYSHTKNTAKFEVVTEYATGLTKSTQVFVFPNDIGDYNIASGGFNLSNYIQRLAKIGIEYDEKYTDNLYRVTTHESLKNFDWTRNFNGLDNDYDNEYVQSGEKFKAIVQIMGYVFDKEKAYIDSIGNVNTITYDSKSNLSNYFLSDVLDNDGWVTNNIYTYDLKQYNKATNLEMDEVDWSETNQKYSYFNRKFSENTTDIISPWKISDNKYIQKCSNGTKQLTLQLVNTDKDYYVDNGVSRNVIKNYFNKTEYTLPDINNEFLKRLKINSKHLLRQKGTIDGVESILSLFGLKSKRWFDEIRTEYGTGYTYNKFVKNLNTKYPYDYSIKEYSSFADPIKETWDDVHGMYRIDYINSCKTIGYDTTEDDGYIPYQGLPVAYRDLDGVWLTPSGETTNKSNKTIYYGSDGEPVKARRLYPYFDQNSQYDGDMYYQMYGGWKNMWPYSFSHDNALIENYGGTISSETLRNVNQVKTIDELISIPKDELYEGVIYYIRNTKTDYAVVDGYLYPLIKEIDDEGMNDYYFVLEVNDESVQVGANVYRGFLVISNREYSTSTIELNGMDDGTKIKVYYHPTQEGHFTIRGYERKIYYFQQIIDGVAVDVEVDAETAGAATKYSEEISPEFTAAFINGSFETDVTDATNYFKLIDGDASNEICSGWMQLYTGDTEYKLVSSIIDIYEGNNPHCGNFMYDSGYEYMSRFDRLFKYPLLNDYFNYDCLSSPTDTSFDDIYNEIENYGFSGLVNSNKDIQTYTEFLHGDDKVHAYTDLMSRSGAAVVYDLNNSNYLDTELGWLSIQNKANRDGVSEQVINTKIIDLCFYLKAKEYYSKTCQEEVKYIQEKILPYVEQMIPSTAILKVKFFIHPFNWVLDGDETDRGQWKEYYYWFNDGQWYNGVKGDINNDGVKNSEDLTLLTKMVNGEVEKLASGDINNDGYVDNDDITAWNKL